MIRKVRIYGFSIPPLSKQIQALSDGLQEQGRVDLVTKRKPKMPISADSQADLPLVNTPDRSFRKTNDAIGLRVTEGKLTLLTRKVFNVMMLHAQEARRPGLNSPLDTPAARKSFWIPLSELAVDADYNSKDTEFLKEQLKELQSIKLLLENERQWTSERLVASVTLANPEGLKKHSGQVWFGYSFPPEVHEMVMAPTTYTKLNIFYQGLLRSGSSLALYEICRRYASNPSKLTLIQPYEHWYGVITGNPVDLDKLPPYKYFKRDVIKLAIAEINQLTDIDIELIEHKNGRRVDRLQFKVERTEQPALETQKQPVVDVELMERVMQFGFSQQEAADFIGMHGSETVGATVSFVLSRQAQKTSAQLDSPAAYFRWAIKGGATAVKELQIQSAVKPAPPRDGKSIMEKFLADRGKQALEIYRETSDDQRSEIYSRFKQAQPTTKSIKLERGIDSPMVRSMLSQWYAQELWGEPSAADVARYVEQLGIPEV